MLQVQFVLGGLLSNLIENIEYLEHCDKGPQEGIKVFSVAIDIAILYCVAEFAAEDVHTEDAERYHARFD